MRWISNRNSVCILGIEDLLKNFGISTESVDRIRLAKGVVGKTTTAVLIVLMVLALAIFKLNNPQLILILGIAAGFVFLVYFIGVMLFAHKNPGPALLEGAELLRWRQFDLATKGSPSQPASPSLPGPGLPGQLPPSKEQGET